LGHLIWRKSAGSANVRALAEILRRQCQPAPLDVS
jgi:hypothetical protein